MLVTNSVVHVTAVSSKCAELLSKVTASQQAHFSGNPVWDSRNKHVIADKVHHLSAPIKLKLVLIDLCMLTDAVTSAAALADIVVCACRTATSKAPMSVSTNLSKYDTFKTYRPRCTKVISSPWENWDRYVISLLGACSHPALLALHRL
jgi:hypothetical protein